MFHGRGGSILRPVVLTRMITLRAPSLCSSSSLSLSVAPIVGPALSIAFRVSSTKAKKKEGAPKKKKSLSADRPTASISAATKKRVAGRAAPALPEEDDELIDDAADETTAALEEEMRKMRESETREEEEEEGEEEREGEGESAECIGRETDEAEADISAAAGRRRRRAKAASGEEVNAEEDASDDIAAENFIQDAAQEDSRFLRDRFPDLAAEYDKTANEEPIDTVCTDSARVVAWKCVECGFKWKSGVFVRTCLRTKCPACEKKRNPPLSSRFVQIWDHTMNDPCVDPKTVLASSYKSAYWRCPTCGASYQARIKDVVSEKASCPSCSLLNLHADFSKDEFGLLQEWHPLKNGDLQPSQVKPTDPTKLWWLCMSCGHEWEATLAARLSKSRRARGKECPVCIGKKKRQ